MRVVAGVARGRGLRAPAGGTRPTSDRVREAVFSVLTSMGAIEGAVVLDLFAGSGALGIEALSRGAKQATFVDHSGDAVASIQSNLEVLGELSARGEVVRADAVRYASSAPPADVVFADPPYDWDGWVALLGALRGKASLVVAETGASLDTGPGWETVKVKRYGGTVVTVVQPVARPPDREEGEI
ncbi:MAG: 16S rRNA (guanine(966)-N(2))-methyltransferase RsmD [Acidimicrobiales bacterium]